MQAQTIHQVIRSGNSLSSGFNGGAALSTTQPFSNLMLSGAAFVPLVESGVESPSSGMANQMTFQIGTGYVVQENLSFLLGASYVQLAQGTATYNAAITAVQTSVTAAAALSRPIRVDAVVYSAGGTDSDNGVSQATYEANMVTLQANYQTDAVAKTSQSGSVVPLLIDQISNWPTTFQSMTGVPAAQWTAARSHQDSIYCIGPRYPYTYVDDSHFVNTSYRKYGEQMGKVLKQILVDHKRWVPLVPRAISRSGATITAQFWVPAGSLVIDTTSVVNATGTVGTSTRFRGFEFFDDSGAPPTVTNVVVATADTLTITLSATPTGTAGSMRLRYAYSGAVGSIPNTATGVAGNIRDSDTMLGLDGANLYNWLISFNEPMGFTWTPDVIPSAITGSQLR